MKLRIKSKYPSISCYAHKKLCQEINKKSSVFVTIITLKAPKRESHVNCPRGFSREGRLNPTIVPTKQSSISRKFLNCESSGSITRLSDPGKHQSARAHRTVAISRDTLSREKARVAFHVKSSGEKRFGITFLAIASRPAERA